MKPQRFGLRSHQEWVGKNLEARLAKEGPAEIFTGEKVGRWEGASFLRKAMILERYREVSSTRLRTLYKI